VNRGGGDNVAGAQPLNPLQFIPCLFPHLYSIFSLLFIDTDLLNKPRITDALEVERQKRLVDILSSDNNEFMNYSRLRLLYRYAVNTLHFVSLMHAVLYRHHCRVQTKKSSCR